MIGKALLAVAAAGISTLIATPTQKRKGRAIVKRAATATTRAAKKVKRAATAEMKDMAGRAGHAVAGVKPAARRVAKRAPKMAMAVPKRKALAAPKRKAAAKRK